VKDNFERLDKEFERLIRSKKWKQIKKCYIRIPYRQLEFLVEKGSIENKEKYLDILRTGFNLGIYCPLMLLALHIGHKDWELAKKIISLIYNWDSYKDLFKVEGTLYRFISKKISKIKDKRIKKPLEYCLSEDLKFSSIREILNIEKSSLFDLVECLENKEIIEKFPRENGEYKIIKLKPDVIKFIFYHQNLGLVRSLSLEGDIFDYFFKKFLKNLNLSDRSIELILKKQTPKKQDITDIIKTKKFFEEFFEYKEKIIKERIDEGLKALDYFLEKNQKNRSKIEHQI